MDKILHQISGLTKMRGRDVLKHFCLLISNLSAFKKRTNPFLHVLKNELDRDLCFRQIKPMAAILSLTSTKFLAFCRMLRRAWKFLHDDI